MEQRIKTYETIIADAAKHPTPELRKYHQEMVMNFQHERLVHLIIMLFFIVLTIGFIITFAWTFAIDLINIPLIVVTALLTILSIAYVRHYYFLENHIQRLYDITTKLYTSAPAKKK